MTEKRLSLEQYKTGLLKGDQGVLGRAITLIESSLTEDEKLASSLMDSIFPYTGNSYRIGITGIPGAGKSTFIEAIGKYLINQEKKVAVLAIDPSSKISGGSLLGDKTRMNELVKNSRAFIRPTPTNNILGGVSGKTYHSILLCEAAGFDYIFIETVGVGQSETEVYDLTDFFLLLMITGMGDELQSMKKGIMELADAVVINKADGDNLEKASKTALEIKHALHLFSPKAMESETNLFICSSIENSGISEIASHLEIFKEKSLANGRWQQKRGENAKHNLKREINLLLQKDFFQNSANLENIKKIENEVAKGKITPQAAAVLLLKNYKEKK